MARRMTISGAADAAGVSVKMIRHYEEIGLLAAAERTPSGYRQYGTQDVAALRFIRQSKGLGFSMRQIADLLRLQSNEQRSSKEVKLLAETHLRALDEKLSEIVAMQAALRQLVDACRGDDDPHCAILQRLAACSAHVAEPGADRSRLVRKARRNARNTDHRPQAEAQPAPHVGLIAWSLGKAANPQH